MLLVLREGAGTRVSESEDSIRTLVMNGAVQVAELDVPCHVQGMKLS